MNLGRISVKGVFLLVLGGMAVSMLAICAVLLWMTGERWVLIGGGLLTLCALAWMFLLAIAFSYMLSGYFGLYSGQKIMYSKFKTNFINKQTH